jgi:hypothetical protein
MTQRTYPVEGQVDMSSEVIQILASACGYVKIVNYVS